MNIIFYYKGEIMAGKCPFGFGKSNPMVKNEGTTNKDWWPNQLNSIPYHTF